MKNVTRRLFLATAGAMLAASALPAAAQSFPTKAVTLVVGYPAGGPIDTAARVLGARLSEIWKQPVIIDNRPGANGAIGAGIASRAAPDGYTLFVNSFHHAVLPSLMPKLSYDIKKDFTPVSFVAQYDIFLVAHPSVPAKSIKELIALAKKEPGKITYASAGSGGGTHLAGELFKLQAGVDLLQIAYKGSAAAMTDVLGGQVNLMFADGAVAVPHIKKGSVKVLGVGSPKRSAVLPDVPTFAESGMKGYEAYAWAGLLAPAATPKTLVDKISKDVATALNHPHAKDRLFNVGAFARPSTPEQYGKFFDSEMTRWAKVIKDANIKLD
jgi:tripartite-type tricarboxylate transporter receptor subunit TctC